MTPESDAPRTIIPFQAPMMGEMERVKFSRWFDRIAEEKASLVRYVTRDLPMDSRANKIMGKVYCVAEKRKFLQYQSSSLRRDLKLSNRWELSKRILKAIGQIGHEEN